MFVITEGFRNIFNVPDSLEQFSNFGHLVGSSYGVLKAFFCYTFLGVGK